MARGHAEDRNSQVTANADGAFASGHARDGGSIFASGEGSHALGKARGWLVGQVATQSGGDGCFAGGYGEECEISSAGDGCFAFGHARYDGDGGARIHARGQGSFALGYLNNTAAYNANSQIYANGKGSFALGRAYNSAPIGALYSSVHATGAGAMAQGFAKDVGWIRAFGAGAHAGGYVESAKIAAGNPAQIYAGREGDFAHGKAQVTATPGAQATMLANGGGSWVGGYVWGNSADPSQDAELYATGAGCFAHGLVFDAHIEASGFGCQAFGNALEGGYIGARANGSLGAGYAIGNNGDLLSDGDGSFACGRVWGPAGAALTRIRAAGDGAWAGGYAQGDGLALTQIYATGRGAFGGGYAYLARIYSSARGSFAHGSAVGGGYIGATNIGAHAMGSILSDGDIVASGYGAFAGGGAAGGDIRATGPGSFAFGRARNGYDILSGGAGSVAMGRAYGANVAAVANNAFQFGEGSNYTADCVQIGSAGIRMKQTPGPFGVPQNGDIWVANNYVYIRSNGVNCKCLNANM
jgi:hypothetical protein